MCFENFRPCSTPLPGFAVKSRCGSRRTWASTCRHLTVSQLKPRSSGPFTTPVSAVTAIAAASVNVVMASNFPFGSNVSVARAAQAHLLTSAHFRARAPGPVSDRLSDTTAREEQSFVPVFPLPFGCRHSLLEHPIPAGGTGPSLRLGYRAQVHVRTPTDVTTFGTIAY